MRNFISIIIILLSIKGQAQKIKFKDQNLKKALIELGYDRNKNHEIEIIEIDTIQSLSITDRKIKHLDDLIYFKNLRKLNVMTNEVTSLKVFEGNLIIEELYVGENKLGPILNINNIPNLKGLYAFRNEIKEFNFENKFQNLESLYIQGNPVENLNVFNLPNLKSLQLFECNDLKIIDLDKNTNLKQLFLLDSKVIKVSENENVKTLYLESNSDPKNTPKVDSIKTAPVIRVNRSNK